MNISSIGSLYSARTVLKNNNSTNSSKSSQNNQLQNNQKSYTPTFKATYSRFAYHPDLIELVKDNSINDEKHFDMHFARLLCSALTSYPKPNPPVAIIADELKHSISFDPKSETDILTGFSNVLRLCPIQKESQDFEELFPLSFNVETNSYDQKANDLLCEMLQETKNIPNRKEVIKEYFQQVKDEETGAIRKSITYPKQYVAGLKK